MQTSATAVRDLLDRLFSEKGAIEKEELLRAAQGSAVGEDALEVMRELPDGKYTHEGLEVRLEDAVREREKARMAGLSGHSEPGFNPPNVRRHPSHEEPSGY